MIIDLAKNYDEHPAFDLNVEPFQIDDTALQGFQSNYECARLSGDAFSSHQQAQCLSSCHLAISHIFQSFKSQCTDRYEKLFFSELHEAVSILIDTEFKYFYRKKSFNTLVFQTADYIDKYNQLCLNQHFTTSVSKLVVQKILDVGHSELEKFRGNTKIGKLKRSDLSINGGPVVRQQIDILNEEFRLNGVLNAVSGFYGQDMIVEGLSFELSSSEANWWEHTQELKTKPPQTLYAHYDEGIQCPKAILYLTDVTEDNGATDLYPKIFQRLNLNPLQEVISRVVSTPGADETSVLHAYYKKKYHQSSNSEGYRRHFLRLPKNLRFYSHFGWDVIPGSDFENEMIKAQQRFIGSAGSLVVFDGARLVHRGGLVKSGERVALQIVFGANSSKRKIKKLIRRFL